jgi:hypothetical protein
VAVLAFGFIQLGLTTFSSPNTECNELEPEYYVCYHGFGNLSYLGGAHYSGEWRRGVRNGNGTMELSTDNS